MQRLTSAGPVPSVGCGCERGRGSYFCPDPPCPFWDKMEANKCWTSLTEGNSQGHTERGTAPQGVTELRTLSKGNQVDLTNVHISHELFIFFHDSLKYLGVGSLAMTHIIKNPQKP